MRQPVEGWEQEAHDHTSIFKAASSLLGGEEEWQIAEEKQDKQTLEGRRAGAAVYTPLHQPLCSAGLLLVRSWLGCR